VASKTPLMALMPRSPETFRQHDQPRQWLTRLHTKREALGHGPPCAGRFVVAVAVAALAACSTARVEPPWTGPRTTGADVGADVVVPTLVELVIAWSRGESEVLRVLGERGGRRVNERAVVFGDLASPVVLAVALAELPPCRADAAAGVVVGDPPRVVGCGAQALAGVAAFIVAAEGIPSVAVVVVADAADLPPLAPTAQLWSAIGGGLSRGADVDIFDVEVVGAGSVDLTLSRADADVDAAAMSLGRALAWQGEARQVAVLVDREKARPRDLLERLVEVVAPRAQPAVRREHCTLVRPTLPEPLVSCDVLPGRGADDVRDDVLRAVADTGTALTIVSRRAPTATSLSTPLATALRARVHDELPRVAMLPALHGGAGKASLCDVARGRANACIAGVPLSLHPAERASGGGEDAVDVAELRALSARVVDVVGLTAPPSSTTSTPTR